MRVLPIFTSHYSFGCSILSLDKPVKPEDYDDTAAKSIIDLCLKNKLDRLILVDNNMSGLITASKNCKDYKIKLRFGIKLVCCDNLNQKNADSLFTEHKVIVFATKPSGYEKVTNFYSKAATDGFYYRPRIDLKYLVENWDDSVSLAIPFYYSYIHQNLLYGYNCIPDFGQIKPFYFFEDNELPFDYLIKDGLKQLNISKEKALDTKTIYYEKKEHFENYLTRKCISERSVLTCPNIDHMGSDKFCLETWLENENRE